MEQVDQRIIVGDGLKRPTLGGSDIFIILLALLTDTLIFGISVRVLLQDGVNSQAPYYDERASVGFVIVMTLLVVLNVSGLLYALSYAFRLLYFEYQTQKVSKGKTAK